MDTGEELPLRGCACDGIVIDRRMHLLKKKKKKRSSTYPHRVTSAGGGFTSDSSFVPSNLIECSLRFGFLG